MASDITLRRVLAGPVDSAPTALAHTDWLYDTPPSALRRLCQLAPENPPMFASEIPPLP